MRERAAAYGGALEAGPQAGGGWRVALRLAADVEAVAR
jgi:signal transduction histidine kinase